MAYIYQADLWCDECGEEICEQIKAEGHAPEDPEDETSYDSDEYPKRGHGGESDSPNHCASGEECLNAIELSDGSKIGALITEELTTDGEEYVRQAIAEGHLCAVEVWAEEWPDLKPDEDEDDDAICEGCGKVVSPDDDVDPDRCLCAGCKVKSGGYDIARKEFDQGGP